MSDEDVSLTEKRVYAGGGGATTAAVASEVGLARVSISDDIVGEFSLERRGQTTAVAAVDALVTAGVRYGVCYVVGSLLGVVYGWADRHAAAVLGGSALVVGVVDAAVSLQSPALAGVCLLAWVGFVPLLLWLAPAAMDRDGPRRLG